ncbi:MAG: glycosyltransferase family 2 protein [Myxococcaceae bacterium]|nr:glycosyltransferase family 2 protein [Myxococcaceae bacterium]
MHGSAFADTFAREVQSRMSVLSHRAEPQVESLQSPGTLQPLDAGDEDSVPFTDVAIVIPAYNEERGVRKGVEEIELALAQLGLSYQVVVVDDGSTDGTRREAEQTAARVLAQPQNRGYGAALKRGIAATRSKYVVITDADGTYPASAIPEMLRLAESADMVVGDRAASMSNVPAVRRPAKYILNSLANYLAQRKISDLNSGLRVFRRKSLEKFIGLLPEGFSFTTTITLCMICSGLEVVYFPIHYGRRIGKSKIVATDFFAFILLVLRIVMLFSPLRVFLPLGAILIALGTAKFVYDVFLWNLSESAVLAILAGLMAWSLGLVADMISRLHLRP